MGRKELEQQLWNAEIFLNRWELLSHGLKSVKISGYFLEFGVWKGQSINFIAENIRQYVWGFDSFKGLPEPWDRGIVIQPMGMFKMGGNFPKIVENVKLEVGLFKDTLPYWKIAHPSKISFINIDSDLYSSAKYILTELNNQIVSGTVIVFDEICCFEDYDAYQNWREGEWKALMEWIEENNREIQFIGRDRMYRAVIKMLN